MRPMTLTEKVFCRVAEREDVTPGETLWVKPDLVSLYEWPGANDRYAEIVKNAGVEQIELADRTVMFFDHMLPAIGEHDAKFHRDSWEWCKKQGVICCDNVGIGHQVMSENGLARPGDLVINHDTHVQPLGAIGCLAITTGMDFPLTMALGKIWLRVPTTVQVELVGEMPEGVGGRDLIHKLVKDYSPQFAIDSVVEFTGPGAEAMNIDERMNLLAQVFLLGCWSGVFPYDRTAEAWLIKQGLTPPEEPVVTDPDAVIRKKITFDLSTLTPHVAAPSDPANVVELGEVLGTPVDQGFIGSCAGGRLEDIRLAAKILKGKRIPQGKRFYVVPTSNKIMAEAMRQGWLSDLVDAGAFISSPTCDYCYGKLQTVTEGETMIGTQTLNIPGRVGSIYANLYLANAAVVAASILNGKITDPREYLEEADA